MNKDMKIDTQCSSVCFMQFLQVSLLGTSQKRSYRKNGTYLAEFWLILESDLVESAPHIIFVESI
jgi:hypothetical protein